MSATIAVIITDTTNARKGDSKDRMPADDCETIALLPHVALIVITVAGMNVETQNVAKRAVVRG